MSRIDWFCECPLVCRVNKDSFTQSAFLQGAGECPQCEGGGWLTAGQALTPSTSCHVNDKLFVLYFGFCLKDTCSILFSF